MEAAAAEEAAAAAGGSLRSVQKDEAHAERSDQTTSLLHTWPEYLSMGGFWGEAHNLKDLLEDGYRIMDAIHITCACRSAQDAFHCVQSLANKFKTFGSPPPQHSQHKHLHHRDVNYITPVMSKHGFVVFDQQ